MTSFTRVKFVVAGGALAWICFQLSALSWEKYVDRATVMIRACRLLSGSTFEERKRIVYGDCNNTGYGYVMGLLYTFPDAERLPLIKYADYERGLELLLPGQRTGIDRRVLVGIGISEDAFLERPVAVAQRRRQGYSGNKITSWWTFKTTNNYERLTRLELKCDPSPISGIAQVRMIESPTSDRILGQWTLEISAGASSFQLPEPIDGFSIGRGATDFILEISQSADAPVLSGITAIGIKVNGTGFVTVNRRAGCFTALQRDFLAEIQRNPDGPWAHFLDSIRNVDFR